MAGAAIVLYHHPSLDSERVTQINTWTMSQHAIPISRSSLERVVVVALSTSNALARSGLRTSTLLFKPLLGAYTKFRLLHGS